MSLEFALDAFPKQLNLKGGLACEARPLESDDRGLFHEFFLAIPSPELLFLKNRVTERETIDAWCDDIDLERNLLSWRSTTTGSSLAPRCISSTAAGNVISAASACSCIRIIAARDSPGLS